MQLLQIPVLIVGLILGAALGINGYVNLTMPKNIWNTVQPNRFLGAIHVGLALMILIITFATIEVLGHAK